MTTTLHQLDVAALSRGLNTLRVARRVIVLDFVTSTNEHAFEKIASAGPAADGTVIFAEQQTAGRGRLGRSWHAPRGSSLTFTALLWEKELPSSPVRWVMAAAIAVSRGIAASTDLEPTIRWPNDVYIHARKVCGILVEARNFPQGWAVAVGIGINCLQQPGHFPPELLRRATSLEIESRHPIDRIKIAQAVLRELDFFLADESAIDNERLALLWRESSADIGTRTTLSTNGHEYRGVIIDIHPATGLILQLDSGPRKLFDPALTSRIS